MSQDNSIFNDAGSTQTTENNQGSPAGTNPNQPDALGTLLAGIKNDRGEQKYKTVEEALKALGHSQAHIPDLKSQLEAKNNELAALQGKASEIDELKDTVAKLTQKLTENASNTSGATFSENDIAEIVAKQLTATQKAERSQQNKASVAEAMSKQFGDKAAEVFYSKAQSLGMSKEQINELAANSPAAVLAMFGVSGGVAQKQTLNLPSGSVNTTGFSHSQAQSMIGRETHNIKIGATHKDTMIQLGNAKSMVEELHNNGMSVHDLTDPATFFKHFG